MGNLGLADAGKAAVVLVIAWGLVSMWWHWQDRDEAMMEELCRLHSPMCER